MKVRFQVESEKSMNQFIINSPTEIVPIMSQDDPVLKEKKWRDLMEEDFPNFLSSMQEELDKNPEGWLVGEALTWADLQLASVIKLVCGNAGSWRELKEPKMSPKMSLSLSLSLSLSPKMSLSHHYERVYCHPRVKRWKGSQSK